jgi:hypothetical protein
MTTEIGTALPVEQLKDDICEKQNLGAREFGVSSGVCASTSSPASNPELAQACAESPL